MNIVQRVRCASRKLVIFSTKFVMAGGISGKSPCNISVPCSTMPCRKMSCIGWVPMGVTSHSSVSERADKVGELEPLVQTVWAIITRWNWLEVEELAVGIVKAKWLEGVGRSP